MIDGATDRSLNENESVYVRCVKNGRLVTRMVSVIEVVHGHADGLVECNDLSFQTFGLSSWREKTVGFYADGALLNLGQEARVELE